jgi:hypothetical protein
MGLLNLIVLIILAGLLMTGINRFIPMPVAIKSLLNFVIFVILVIYVLEFFDLLKNILPFPTILK